MDDKKFADLMQNREFVIKILNTSDINKVQELFKDKGLDLSIDELKDISDSITHIAAKLIQMNGELADKNLDEVSGGGKVAKASAVAFTGLLLAGTLLACAYGYDRGKQEVPLATKIHQAKANFIGTTFSEDLDYAAKRIWSGWKAAYNDLNR